MSATRTCSISQSDGARAGSRHQAVTPKVVQAVRVERTRYHGVIDVGRVFRCERGYLIRKATVVCFKQRTNLPLPLRIMSAVHFSCRFLTPRDICTPSKAWLNETGQRWSLHRRAVYEWPVAVGFTLNDPHEFPAEAWTALGKTNSETPSWSKSLKFRCVDECPGQLGQCVILLEDDQTVDGVPEALCPKCQERRYS